MMTLLKRTNSENAAKLQLARTKTDSITQKICVIIAIIGEVRARWPTPVGIHINNTTLKVCVKTATWPSTT